MKVDYKYKICFCKNCQTMRLAMDLYTIDPESFKYMPMYTIDELEKMTKEELDYVNRIDTKFHKRKCTVCKENIKQ